MISPTEILEQALEEINRCGLHKGSFSADSDDPDSAVCSLGAINRVVSLQNPDKGYNFSPTTSRAAKFATVALIKALSSVLPHAHKDQFVYIPTWNDAPSTTEEDVKLVFKLAIADLKEKE